MKIKEFSNEDIQTINLDENKVEDICLDNEKINNEEKNEGEDDMKLVQFSYYIFLKINKIELKFI